MTDAEHRGEPADTPRARNKVTDYHSGSVVGYNLSSQEKRDILNNTDELALWHSVTMVNPRTFADRIVTLRRRANETQAETAEAVGAARSTIAVIETGRYLPGRDVVQALAAHFAVSVDALLANDSAPPAEREIIENPNEIALVRFWRALSPKQRETVVRVLVALDPAAAAKGEVSGLTHILKPD